MSVFQWFNAREATAAGSSLADELEPKAAAMFVVADGKHTAGGLQDFLQRAERTVGALELNFYKRAKLANSFKWKLLQSGVEPGLVDELTRILLVRLAGK